jgi:UDP-N-acetylmuramoylalanine--D-glutamate ligase
MIDWSRHNRQSDWTKINACVVGLGVAGFAAADALIEVGATVTVIDNGNGERQKEHGTVLEILGAQIYLDYKGEIPANTNLLVVSPGVRPSAEIINEAQKKNIEIWGEFELAWRLRPLDFPAPWLCVFNDALINFDCCRFKSTSGRKYWRFISERCDGSNSC